MAEIQILIVEDEPIVAMDLEHRLESLGYAVAGVVSSGEEAIDKAAETRPDLVLMDIKLTGEMDGVVAASHIWDRFDIPVVYVTAYADRETFERARETEPFGYLLKPFEAGELRTTIGMALYRHGLERKLKESEEWLATTLNSIGDAVIATDDGETIRFINPVAEALTGWTQQQATGRKFTEVFNILNEETRTPIQSPVAKVLQEGVVTGLGNKTLLIAKDGTERPILDTAAPIKDGRGNVTGLVLVFRDVTEQRHLERQLRLQETALESAADSIFITDREGVIVWVNPAFTELSGYTAEEALGRTPRILKSGKYDQAFYRNLWDTILSGRTWQGELVNRRKDDSLYIKQATVTPVRDLHGEITHFVSIGQDVTARKRVEERYRSLFEASRDVVFISTPEGRFLDINPAGVELLGYDSKQELLEVEIARDLFFNPQQRDRLLREMMQQGFVKDFELVLKRKDGQKLMVLETANAVRDATGAIVEYQGILREAPARQPSGP